MPQPADWKVPSSVQPKAQDYAYDLERALAAVVAVHTIVPPHAFSAETLGTERAGNGVLIRDDGVDLTICYLITEAEQGGLPFSHRRLAPGASYRPGWTIARCPSWTSGSPLAAAIARVVRASGSWRPMSTIAWSWSGCLAAGRRARPIFAPARWCWRCAVPKSRMWPGC